MAIGWLVARTFVFALLLDGAIAYGLHMWLNPQEPYGWVWILLAIWAVSLVVGIRRWIYTLASTFINQPSITESTRQALVDAEIPTPPRFGMPLTTYLVDVADDRTLSDPVRIAAALLAKEVTMSARNLGLISGSLYTMATDKALDKLRR